MEPPRPPMEPPRRAKPNRLLSKIEQTVLEIRRQTIEKTVRDILKHADVETATEAGIRASTAERLSIDLSDIHSKLLVRRTLEAYLLSTANVEESEDVLEQTREVDVQNEQPQQQEATEVAAVQNEQPQEKRSREVDVEEEQRKQQRTREVTVQEEQTQQQRNTALPNADTAASRDDLICELSEKRRVSIQEYRGKPLVSIRDYYQRDGRLRPSKNGISLTPYQWSSLKSSFPDIEAAVAKLTSKISESTGKKTVAANPNAVTALASQRSIPAEREEIEANGKQTGIENPTVVTALASERALVEADGKQTETANPTSITALASERALVEAGATSSAAASTPRGLVPIAPTRLNGRNYHCWMHQIEFFLEQLKIAYVLTDPYPSTSVAPEASFEETVRAKMNAQKWVDDDYICRQNILNLLDDHLFNKYSRKTYSAKGLWEALKSAYDEDFQTKTSHVNKYIHFEMVDGVSVIEQVEELHKIANLIVASGVPFDESFHVSTIISKLPPSWKQCRVKLMQEDSLPWDKLIYKLRNEEELRDLRKKEEQFKNARIVNSSNDDKVGPRKRVCYTCGKEGHKSMNCPRRFDARERSTAIETDNVPVSSEVKTVEKAEKRSTAIETDNVPVSSEVKTVEKAEKRSTAIETDNVPVSSEVKTVEKAEE